MKIGMFGHLGCSECMWFCKFFFLKKNARHSAHIRPFCAAFRSGGYARV